MVCDAIGEIINNGTLLDEFVKENRNIATKVLQGVQELLAKVRAYLSRDVKLNADNKKTFSELEKEISEKAEEVIEKCEEEGESKTAASGLFSRLPQLFGFKGQDLLRTPVRLGTEELVLLGVALLLFFTKDGDRECALMIALLLFIK
jgi:hypothetical protein